MYWMGEGDGGRLCLEREDEEEEEEEDEDGK